MLQDATDKLATAEEQKLDLEQELERLEQEYDELEGHLRQIQDEASSSKVPFTMLVQFSITDCNQKTNTRTAQSPAQPGTSSRISEKSALNGTLISQSSGSQPMGQPSGSGLDPKSNGQSSSTQSPSGFQQPPMSSDSQSSRPVLFGGLNKTLSQAPVGHQLQLLKGKYGFKTPSNIGICY